MSNLSQTEIDKVVDYLRNCEDVVRCQHCLHSKLVRSKLGDKWYCTKFVDAETGEPFEVNSLDYCSRGVDDGLPF